MPEYLAPGVYIQEVPSANKAIQAASTSTAGMVGLTERGPVGVPTFITSVAQFRRIFGGLLDHSIYTGGQDALPHAVNGFFANGGARVYVVRILGDTAARATDTLQGGGADALQVFARSQGRWGNTVRLTVSHSSRVQTKLAVDAVATDTDVTLASTFGLNAGDAITIGAAAHTVTQVNPLKVITIAPQDRTTLHTALEGKAQSDLELAARAVVALARDLAEVRA